MKIFITGASGFVGGAAARVLSKDHEIVAMSRSTVSDAKIEALGIVPTRCSLNEVTAEHLAGCDVVLHCAAFVEEWGPLERFERLNVTATQQLIDVAKQVGVRRFLHISTEAVLFHGQHLRDIDENYPLALNSPFPYPRTKARAEQLVRASTTEAFETLVLRPRMIWGENDQTILPAITEAHNAGKFAWVNGGTAMTSTTHIDNLVHGISLALTKGKSGEVYFIIDGDPVCFRDFMDRYAKSHGIHLGKASVPGWVLRGFAAIVEPIWRLVGATSPPPVTRFTAAIISRDCTINGKKAERELGYAPVLSLEQGLRRLEGRSPSLSVSTGV